MIFKRLRNLWELSNYRIDERIEWVGNTSVRHAPRLVNEAKPKGEAIIVDMTEKEELFPSHQENL